MLLLVWRYQYAEVQELVFHRSAERETGQLWKKIICLKKKKFLKELMMIFVI